MFQGFLEITVKVLIKCPDTLVWNVLYLVKVPVFLNFYFSDCKNNMYICYRKEAKEQITYDPVIQRQTINIFVYFLSFFSFEIL